ncbi:MAG: winged helix-turn-helix transcriptional regulator [Planctomycetaceae bacterium]|jgi:DNA-binding MarR family transcriptional regulator|nr:winged helix-turn-helix transcriptional regulator [Planctomycetaceae bacterium]
MAAATSESPMSADKPHLGWTFLSNHAHVMLCLSRDPTLRMRDIALEVGITERAIRHIISDLEKAGYVERLRIGRRNSYRIDGSMHLRHPIEQHKTIADLIRAIHD